MTFKTLLLVAAGWFTLLGLILAVLVVGARADEVAPRRRRRRRRLGWLVPHLRRPLPVWASLMAGLVVGSIAGVFAGSVIVNAVKPPPQPPPVPEPWIPPDRGTGGAEAPAGHHPAPAH